MSRARQAFGTTTAIFGSLFRGAATGITTYLAHENMQDEPAPKNKFSGFYAFATTVNSINVSLELYDFLTHIIASGAWRDMTAAERLSIGVLVTAGAVSTGYSFWRIAASPDILAAGVSAATGAMLFSLANTVTNHSVRRQMNNGEHELLLNTFRV